MLTLVINIAVQLDLFVGLNNLWDTIYGAPSDIVLKCLGRYSNRDGAVIGCYGEGWNDSARATFLDKRSSSTGCQYPKM